MKKGKNRKNFEVYSALEFIAAITHLFNHLKREALSNKRKIFIVVY